MPADAAHSPADAAPVHPVGEDIARLVQEHHAAVYRYAFRLSGASADAEDLVQQTFMAAQTKLSQLRDRDRARNWLFAILRNCYLRGQKRRPPVPCTDLELDVAHLPEELPAEADIDSEALQRALDELPDEFRLVVVMFYFEERSYREIAEQLDVPVGTVMSRLSRAKGHLRAKLLSTAQSHGQPRTVTSD